MTATPFIILAAGMFLAILIDRGMAIREPWVHWFLGALVGLLAAWSVFK